MSILSKNSKCSGDREKNFKFIAPRLPFSPLPSMDCSLKIALTGFLPKNVPSTVISVLRTESGNAHPRNRQKSTVRAFVRRWRSPVSGFRTADVPGFGAQVEKEAASTGTLFLTGLVWSRCAQVWLRRKFQLNNAFGRQKGSTFVSAFSAVETVNGRGLGQISSARRGHLSLDVVIADGDWNKSQSC